MDCDIPEQRDILHPTTQKFTSLLESAGTRSLNFVQHDDFTEAYKSVMRVFKNKNPGERAPLAGSSREAEKMMNSLKQDVKVFLKEEIDHCVDSEDLNRKFRELEEIKEEFHHKTECNKAWRPPGDAEAHMIPFNKVSKVEERNRLVRLVHAEREKLNILKSRLETKRKEVTTHQQVLERNKTTVETLARVSSITQNTQKTH